MVACMLVVVLMARIGQGRWFGTGERACNRLRRSTDKQHQQQPNGSSMH
jgi:hypothetical protein